MEVILDELTPVEFFKYGGIVKIDISDEKFINDFKTKKKYTFFDYKEYSRFLRKLYASCLVLKPEMKNNEIYKFVNSYITISPSIGHFLYVNDLDYDNTLSYEMAKFYYYGEKREQEISPRDPYGIKNVCFSTITEDDDEWDEYRKQRLSRGFDDSELWSLDGTISKFIYPRIKAFRENSSDMSPDMSDAIDKMIEGFKLLANDRIKTDDEVETEKEAIKLLEKYYFDLYL